MRKELSVFVFLFCFTGYAFAQGNFLPGYIITLQNDTVYGHVHDQNAVKKMSSCHFRPAGSKEVVMYAPGEIHAYGYNDYGVFVSMPYISEDSIIVKDMFYEVLFDGVVQLYMIREDGRDVFFIAKGDDFHRLSKDMQLVYVEEEKKVYQFDKRYYTGLLTHVMSDVPWLKPHIEKTKLSPYPLISLARTYHEQIADHEPVIPYYSSDYTLKITPVIGMKHNRLYATDKMSEVHMTSLNPEAGIMINLQRPHRPSEPFIMLEYDRFYGKKINRSYSFLDFSSVNLNLGISTPHRNLSYSAYTFASVQIARIYDYNEYRFPKAPDQIEVLRFNYFRDKGEISKYGFGFTLGHQRIRRLGPKLDLVMGLKTSFLGMAFNEKYRFTASAGIQMGITYKQSISVNR